MRQGIIKFGLVGLAGLWAVPVSFAAAGGTQGSNSAGAGLFLGLAIAYLARRRAIGGWLLYFYMQLYVSLLVSLLFLRQVIENLNPEGWDNAFTYALFFLSTAPVLAAQAAEVVLGSVLLFRRDESTVRMLRVALAALCITSGAALAIDLAKFNEGLNVFFDVLTFGFSAIWWAYFRRSTRVRLVFVERNWDYAAISAPRILTPPERKYLAKRAALAACLTFVTLLLLMGAALEDKQPDGGLFFVPVFYALIAAAVGWYSPIRKKKRASLLQQLEPAESGELVGALSDRADR